VSIASWAGHWQGDAQNLLAKAGDKMRLRMFHRLLKYNHWIIISLSTRVGKNF